MRQEHKQRKGKEGSVDLHRVNGKRSGCIAVYPAPAPMVRVGFGSHGKGDRPGKVRRRAIVVAVQKAPKTRHRYAEGNRRNDRVGVAQEGELANAQVECDGGHPGEEATVFRAASRPERKPCRKASIIFVAEKSEQAAAPN